MRNRISKILIIQLISTMLIMIGTCNVYGETVTFTPPAEVHGGMTSNGGQCFCAQKGAPLGGATTYTKLRSICIIC